ncbi:uncharacterized protein B0I36DRAFT_330086 [Microdochium trichocladiopsis]|uniref:Tetratricopeptide SHNi-TPR domain-containing protein n=1 Tax=Microdochium trichocladiopsis TaxID=1682393 RepID=A0A9P9BK29_9PEZI|nr:uncharacterized protein B0I36DRAFT_330086 [Microdochium trichocladiopsis]KAH7026199.1 hypothetical protein B0I36DRAFT_330086 [Microdochium trichocladiopsis]
MADTPTHTLSAVPSRLASGAATPVSLPPLDDEGRTKSIMVSLADLTAKANAFYAQKKYEDATELFAQAAEMQAEFNGEMSPENANVLFLYGRSLFRVGQSKSDVLGGKAATDKKSKPASKPKSQNAAAAPSTTAKETEGDRVAEERVAEEGVAIVAKEASGLKEDADKLPDAKKPLFQFTGDENWEGSDDEDDDEAEGDEDEEEEDDLAVAFEVLDLARVLFEKRLEALEEDSAEGKGKEVAEGDSPTAKHIKERLGDTHDLLAEISLENEKYPEAIKDSRASLKYKTELYPTESEIIAEAHFKLSLALEFASITSSSDEEGGGDAAGPKQIDQSLRDEAATELEKAIDSTKLKLKNKEVELAMMHVPEENEETRKTIADVKDMIADMEQRLIDLRKPPVDVDSMLGADNPMSGILGAALGESSSETAARVEQAKKNATDLSGLVRKKAKKEEPATPPADTNGSGSKRKAEDDEPAAADHEAPKKARVDDDDDATATA